jgi:hypothetical protein
MSYKDGKVFGKCAIKQSFGLLFSRSLSRSTMMGVGKGRKKEESEHLFVNSTKSPFTT